MNASPLLAGVMGWPIAHSRSPRLHGHWLRRYGIDGYYIPIGLPPDPESPRFLRIEVPIRMVRFRLQGSGRSNRFCGAQKAIRKANGSSLSAV